MNTEEKLKEDLLSKMIQARKWSGFTQKEVAERMGTIQPRISNAETGKEAFSVRFAQRFIEACGCKLRFHHVSLIMGDTQLSTFLG